MRTAGRTAKVMRNRFGNAEQFERAVLAFVEQHGMFSACPSVGVAVSGGADSVCLLLSLAALQPLLGCKLEVLHINHGLRGADSDADEQFVQELADSMALPIRCHRIAAGAAPETGIEEWARHERQTFFLALLEKGAVSRIATAHHRTDQAETVLFRLLRGAGSHGLGGIEPLTPHGLARPLLSHGSDEIRHYLSVRGAKWREDATNTDLRFSRNALRHHWIPALTKAWNPQLESLLAGTAEQLRAESAYLQQQAEAESARLFRQGIYGWEANVAEFGALAIALQRRVILHAAHYARAGESSTGDSGSQTDLHSGAPVVDSGGAGPALSFHSVEVIRELFTRPRGHGRFVAARRIFERSGALVRISLQHEEITALCKAAAVEVGEPGQFGVLGSRRRIEVRYLAGLETDISLVGDAKCGYTEGWSLLRSSRVRFPLQLRYWRNGDQLQPVGCESNRKIKQLFQRRGVPVWRRSQELVLEMEGVVIWSSSFGAAAECCERELRPGILAVRVLESNFPEI